MSRNGPPPGWPEGYGRAILAETDSTNAEAARRAAIGADAPQRRPEWILAHSQQAARGRRGRPWAMVEGNFAATLLLYPAERAELVALRSFVAALALHDAFVAATGRADPFALKWPNDVLLNGGKVAGILLESTGQGARVGHLAIGIGINLVSAPAPALVEPRATRPVSLLDETGARVSPEDFLNLLAPAYAARETELTRHGFAPIRDAWLARAARLGERITARTTTTTTEGIFETVDAGGNLVLNTSDGRRAIPAAEVFF